MPLYNQFIPKKEPVAILGCTENYLNLNNADLYDLQLNNWDINSDWELNKKYNSIISTRCPYFAKNPETFITKCHEYLNDGGEIFVDWGLGDHWRFKNYKIGWVKDGEHESFYGEGNYLWSTVWDDSFLKHPQFLLFKKRVERFGYKDMKKAITDEVPSILDLEFIRKYFDIEYDLLALWEDTPQLYIFIKGTKK
jgi:hypothetical protein